MLVLPVTLNVLIVIVVLAFPPITALNAILATTDYSILHPTSTTATQIFAKSTIVQSVPLPLPVGPVLVSINLTTQLLHAFLIAALRTAPTAHQPLTARTALTDIRCSLKPASRSAPSPTATSAPPQPLASNAMTVSGLPPAGRAVASTAGLTGASHVAVLLLVPCAVTGRA